MKENLTIKERLIAFIAYLGIGQGKFEKNCGLANAYVANIRKSITPEKLQKISQRYPELNTGWLMTGEGEMLKGNIEPTDKAPEPVNANYRLVPVIHIDSVGGMHSSNAIVDEPQYVEEYVPFVNARKDDKAIYQSGNSMIPTIPPGCLIQIREVKQWREYFGYGNIYVIELNDGRRLTKEVAKYEPDPKNYILCKSHNPEVADEELPRSMIVSVWKVINILINKGW